MSELARSPIAWLLVAAALTLCGRPRAYRAIARTGPARERRPLSLPMLRVLAALGTVAICVVACGPGRGLLASVIAVPAVGWAVTRAHSRPSRERANPSLALALDLIAVGLRAGQPLAAALVLAAPAAEAWSERLGRVGGLLQLGADPAEAWRVVGDDVTLAPIAAAACRSAASGIRLAAAFEQLAVDVRAELAAAAEARAHRAGVLVAAPLGLCFLPSFVCLGVVPVVIGIAEAALPG